MGVEVEKIVFLILFFSIPLITKKLVEIEGFENNYYFFGLEDFLLGFLGVYYGFFYFLFGGEYFILSFLFWNYCWISFWNKKFIKMFLI